MRHLTLAFLVLAVTSCGDEGTGMDMSMDMAMDLNMSDLTVPPDFAGVSCGTSTCDTATQECCGMFNGTALSETCVSKGSCTGAAITCDGPEDCPGQTSSTNSGCCVSLSGMMGDPDAGTMTMGSGSSSCTNSCVGLASYDGSNLSITTKLCHAKTDCTGYMGTLMIFGTPNSTKFDSCCQSTQTGSYRFCFSSATAAMSGGAVTCSAN
jgi:hypothetical protein